MRTIGLVVIVLSGVAAVPSGAQSPGDHTMFFALSASSIAGLPPLATSTVLADVQKTPELALRYGYVPATNGLPQINNFGATAVLPLGFGSTASLTGGVVTASSTRSELMLSAGADTRITEMPFGTAPTSFRLRFAVNGEIGYAARENGHIVAGSVGLPISLVQGGVARDALRIVPFVAPAWGFANSSLDNVGTLSGSRFIANGGIALFNRTSSVGAQFGFQFVAIPNAQPTLGLTVVLGGR